ncbi:Alpha/Beta hydrolase protein [Auriculariales sp. MPI-PUGE-AT-0066]|nr:Alpha/Beta hydrolase protein [Auriculariales sp. MPI-PUGE-AT-0066]
MSEKCLGRGCITCVARLPQQRSSYTSPPVDSLSSVHVACAYSMVLAWLYSFVGTSSATPAPTKPLSDLLTHYEVPASDDGRVPAPPSARVTAAMKEQRQAAPASLRDLWSFGSFFAFKATELASEFIWHHVSGPPKKSWGIEMTMIVALMRNLSYNSHLADIRMIRALLQLGGMVPLPSDALVTPVTFRVRKRNLRGILAKLDAAEDGTRELSGEWVVGKRLWHRLNSEWKTQQKRSADDSQSTKAGGGHKHRVILFIHGGAYYMMSAATHRFITIPLSKFTEARIFALDYRLAPETRFPGPMHDVVSAYFRLIDDLRIPPENVIVAGDSAGGGLTLALLMYLRDNDYPMPAGAMLFSPWVDLTMSCDSWDSNARYDIVPRPIPGDHMDPIMCYLGEGLEQYLTHPYASPLFGDFTRLPPMLIQAGEAECLRDEITLLAHKATRAGVQVVHELFQDGVHVFQMFPFLDLATEAFKSCRNFVRHVLPLHVKTSPKMLDGPVEAELEHETSNRQSILVRGDGQEEGAAPDSEEIATPSPSREPSDSDSDSAAQGDDRSSWAYDPEKSEVQIKVVSDSGSDDESKAKAAPTPETSSTIGFPTQPAPLRRTLSSLGRFYISRPPSPEATTSRRKKLSLHYPSSSSSRKTAGPDSQILIPLDGAVPPQLNIAAQSSGSEVTPESPTGGRRKRSPTVSVTHTNRDAPPPAVRQARERTKSHPDITALCADWRRMGPANTTTTYQSQASLASDKSP